MPLRVLVDPTAIRAVVTPLIVADPVRHTLLATIAESLTESAWCAAWDGGLAVRSGAAHAVVLAGAVDGALAELAPALRQVPSLRSLAGSVDAVRATVAACGTPVGREISERLYRLDELTPPTVPGSAVIAGPDDRELIRRWYHAFAAEAHVDHRAGDEADETQEMDEQVARSIAASGCWLWLRADATPVAMAARRPVAAGSARVGPVYTPPEHRGHGYASGVTAAATHSILAEGAVPVLFTDLANPTSNKIYRALGYVPVEDRLVVTLG